MSLAETEPKATRKPMVNGSVSTANAAVEAIRRFDGPANGMRFRAKEVSRTPKRSAMGANPFPALVSSSPTI